MHKRVSVWYITAVTLIVMSDFFVILAALSHWAFGSIVSAGAAGLTLPLLLGVIGKSAEVRRKDLRILPVLSAVSLAVAVVVYVNIPGHMWFPGIEELIGVFFAVTCFTASAVILVISVVHAVITKKKRYKEFLAESRIPFPEHRAMYVALLAAVSGVSVIGYTVLIIGAGLRLWDIF